MSKIRANEKEDVTKLQEKKQAIRVMKCNAFEPVTLSPAMPSVVPSPCPNDLGIVASQEVTEMASSPDNPLDFPH
jgi:hypothetical protein